MTHEHGSEYQLRIVHEDETEELRGWMNRPEDVAQTITVGRQPNLTGSRYERFSVSTTCIENKVVEFPLTPIAAENSRFPRQPDRRPFTSASGRTFSTGA